MMSLCLLGGLLVSRHLGMRDYALLFACAALSTGLVRQGFCWASTPVIYLLMLVPEPWNAIPVFALTGVFALPFLERKIEAWSAPGKEHANGIVTGARQEIPAAQAQPAKQNPAHV